MGVETDCLPDETSSALKKLKELGVPIKRHSEDKNKNQHGDKLLELCRNCDLFIVNGISSEFLTFHINHNVHLFPNEGLKTMFSKLNV